MTVSYQSSSRRSRRKKNNGIKPQTIIIILLLGAALLLGAHMLLSRSSDNRSGSANKLPGADLTSVITNPGQKEVIIQYMGMTVSFNPDLHIPNWVAWELTADEAAGTEPRYDKFSADPDVDGSASPRDYTSSGYDRGHMAPAGDMKWNEDAMRQTFFMTNICPQAGELNRGSWRKLEEKCRARTTRDSAVIIVCGPVLKGANPITGYIGDSKVAVPAKFFKVVLSPYTNPPTAIGFIMPNGSVAGGMQKCAMTVDEVERLTGHDFFSQLPDSIESVVESTCNFNKWSRLK